MESVMRKNLFKHIFYMIVAFCFMSAGAFALTLKTKTNSAFAADTSSTEIVNENIPAYFNATQYTGETENASSLIDSNIFMYSNDESLKLSFETNGSFNTSVSDIYKYVYYGCLYFNFHY